MAVAALIAVIAPTTVAVRPSGAQSAALLSTPFNAYHLYSAAIGTFDHALNQFQASFSAASDEWEKGYDQWPSPTADAEMNEADQDQETDGRQLSVAVDDLITALKRVGFPAAFQATSIARFFEVLSTFRRDLLTLSNGLQPGADIVTALDAVEHDEQTLDQELPLLNKQVGDLFDSTGASVSVLDQAGRTLQRSSAALGYRLEVDLSTDERIVATGLGAANFLGNGLDLTIEFSSPPAFSGVSFEERYLRGEAYVGGSAVTQLLPGRSWAQVPRVDQSGFGNNNPLGELVPRIGPGTSVDFVGAYVTGARTIGDFHLTVSPSAVRQQLRSEGLSAWQQRSIDSSISKSGLKADYWVDSDGLLVRAEYQLPIAVQGAPALIGLVTFTIARSSRPISVRPPPSNVTASPQEFQKALSNAESPLPLLI